MIDSEDDDKVAGDFFLAGWGTGKDDGWEEYSINWYDDEGAKRNLLDTKNDEQERVYEVGVAIVSRAKVDEIKRSYQLAGLLDYNRDEIEGNPYHGNLLRPSDLPKAKKRAIGYALLVTVLGVKRRGED
jgi:hypothetical protein